MKKVMKTVLFTLCIAILIGSDALGQVTDTNSVAHPALRQELLQMVKADQAIRRAIIEKDAANPGDSLDSARAAIDSANTARMKQIIQDHGWPGPDLVGREGSEAAFLLVQHADHDRPFQRKVLPLVREAYEAGTLDGQSYALLLDRVRVGEGKAQVYGTQAKPFDQWVDGEPVLYPIEDRANVDQRREEVGLFPLEEYLNLLKQVYFPNDQ